MAKQTKITKITDEELAIIVDLQKKINSNMTHIGFLEVQKQEVFNNLNIVNRQVDQHKALLFDKYGDINIDIETGVYTPKTVTDNRTLHKA